MAAIELSALALAGGCFCAVAGGFLLLGWRLGRESVGRPMFEFQALRQDASCDQDDAQDPWDAAMLEGNESGGREE